MNANRADSELEGTELRSQLVKFQVSIILNCFLLNFFNNLYLQFELETIRIRAQKLTDENETLRRELRRSVEERLSGIHSDTVLNLNNDSIVEVQKRQLELLEEEKYEAMRLYELGQQRISELEEENNDLKNPLKPHLIKLDMQTKQVNVFFM